MLTVKALDDYLVRIYINMSQENFIKQIILPLKKDHYEIIDNLKDNKKYIFNCMNTIESFSPDDNFYKELNFLSNSKYDYFFKIIGENLYKIINTKDILQGIENTSLLYPALSEKLTFYCVQTIANNKYNINEIIDNLDLLCRAKLNFYHYLFSKVGKENILKLLPHINQDHYERVIEIIFIENKNLSYLDKDEAISVVKKYNHQQNLILKKINYQKIDLIIDLALEDKKYNSLLFVMFNKISLSKNKKQINEIIDVSSKKILPENIYLLVLYRLCQSTKKEEITAYTDKIFTILFNNNMTHIIDSLADKIEISEIDHINRDQNLINRIKNLYTIYYKNFLSNSLSQKEQKIKPIKI